MTVLLTYEDDFKNTLSSTSITGLDSGSARAPLVIGNNIKVLLVIKQLQLSTLYIPALSFCCIEHSQRRNQLTFYCHCLTDITRHHTYTPTTTG
jgi:hypothetical protein